MENLRRRWLAWLALMYPEADYPPGSARGEVAGLDLALLDGDAAAVVHWYLFESDRLHAGEEIIRSHSLAALTQVVPLLSEAGRAYFEPLLEMLEEVDRLKAAESQGT